MKIQLISLIPALIFASACTMETAPSPTPVVQGPTGATGMQMNDAGSPPPPGNCLYSGNATGTLTLINNSNEAVNIVDDGPATYPYALDNGQTSAPMILIAGRYLVTATGTLTNATILSQIIDVGCSTSQTIALQPAAPPSGPAYPKLTIYNKSQATYLDVTIRTVWQNTIPPQGTMTYDMPTGHNLIEVDQDDTGNALKLEDDNFTAGTTTYWTITSTPPIAQINNNLPAGNECVVANLNEAQTNVTFTVGNTTATQLCPGQSGTFQPPAGGFFPLMVTGATTQTAYIIADPHFPENTTTVFNIPNTGP